MKCNYSGSPAKDCHADIMLGILVLPVFFTIRLGRWYFTEHVCWSALSGSVLNSGVILWRHRSCIQITFYSLSTKSNTFLVFFFTILLSIQCASQCLQECERIVEGHWATPSRSIWGSLSRCGRGSGPGSLVRPGKGSGPALGWVVRRGWVQAEKHKKAWTKSREEVSSGWLYSKTGDFFPFCYFVIVTLHLRSHLLLMLQRSLSGILRDVLNDSGTKSCQWRLWVFLDFDKSIRTCR